MPIISQLNPIQSLKHNFFKIMFIIAFFSASRPSKSPFPIRLYDCNMFCILVVLHQCYMSCPSHTTWLNHSNNICQIIDNLNLQPPAHAGSSRADFFNLKMEAICSSETKVYIRSTRRHIPEDGILHSHRREKLKSMFLCFFAFNFRSNSYLTQLQRYLSIK
jgi:hypothetical protein